MATNSDYADLLKKTISGEISFHKLDSLTDGETAVKIRKEALEKRLSLQLNNISSSILNAKECDANIENMIGAAQIPLGIAGSLKVNGEFAKGDFFIPLATTEGALVASVNRGCSVINKSGGASAVIIT